MKNILDFKFFKYNFSLIISITLITICAISYLFILEDTFNFSNIQKNEKSFDNKELEFSSEPLNIDTLNTDTLELIDSTEIQSNLLVFDASYKISNLDYYSDSFKVPYININSNDAKLVNEEIKNNYKLWAKDSAKYKKAFSNSSLDASLLIRTDYTTYTYENILSILITFVTREDSIEARKYYSYSFDTSNDSLFNSNSLTNNLDSNNAQTQYNNIYGKLLVYNEILNKLNLSFEEIDTKYKEILHIYSGEYGDLNNISDTLSLYDEEIKSKTLKAFIDNDGNLNLISKVFTPLYTNGTYRIFKYIDSSFTSSAYLGATNTTSDALNTNPNEGSILNENLNIFE